MNEWNRNMRQRYCRGGEGEHISNCVSLDIMRIGACTARERCDENGIWWRDGLWRAIGGVEGRERVSGRDMRDNGIVEEEERNTSPIECVGIS